MKATFRPLRWSEPSTPIDDRRSRHTFKANWSNTLTLLDIELWHLDATDLVIEADFREGDIRIDGMPRANARQPVHPGVKVAFGSKFGPLVYSTDSCVFWQHNVRSIALGLEALRAVDRYGVTKRGEQYTGWKAIGAAPTAMPAPMSKDQAAVVIGALAGMAGADLLSWRDPTLLRAAYSKARRRAHPDTGGSAELFQRLQDAKRVLGFRHTGDPL